MKTIAQIVARVGLLISAITLLAGSTAWAHVVVKPAEVVTAGFQTFSMGVPNEKDSPTTSIKLVIPDGLKYVSPTQKAGWQIDVEKTGTGEDAVVKSITWSGNTVNAGYRDDFTFSAQVPATTTELHWKAYQTYQDGSVVSWDQTPPTDGSDDEKVTPFSVTKVVAESAADVSIGNSAKKASDANNTATVALSLAGISTIVALVAIYLSSRPAQKSKK